MSKLKTNTIENVAGTKSETVDNIIDQVGTSNPGSTLWDGIVLDETTTPKLSEVGILGTNPYATLYPDGSIVGGSDNGKFTKHANRSKRITIFCFLCVLAALRDQLHY